MWQYLMFYKMLSLFSQFLDPRSVLSCSNWYRTVRNHDTAVLVCRGRSYCILFTSSPTTFLILCYIYFNIGVNNKFFPFIFFSTLLQASLLRCFPVGPFLFPVPHLPDGRGRWLTILLDASYCQNSVLLSSVAHYLMAEHGTQLLVSRAGQHFTNCHFITTIMFTLAKKNQT